MFKAYQQAKKVEDWLEAAESGDFSDVEFPEYEGNGLASPVMTLSVYEEDGELRIDDDVVKEYAVQNEDIDYRSLQKLAGDAGVNPIGKTRDELLDVVTEEHGDTERVVDELMSHEDEFGYTEFKSTVQESLVDRGVNGRQELRERLSTFKEESNYQNLDGFNGGENMSDIEEAFKVVELALDDHYSQAELKSQYDDAVVDKAYDVASRVESMAESRDEAVEQELENVTNYLLGHREHMDDKTVERMDQVEELEQIAQNYEDGEDLQTLERMASGLDHLLDVKYTFDF